MKRSMMFLAMFAVLVTVTIPAVSANPVRPAPTKPVTTLAVNCDEAIDYFLWFFPMLLEDEDALAAIQGVAETDDIMTMTRREYRTHGAAFLDLADTMGDYDPPPTMRQYHEAQTGFFVLVGELFTLAGESGIFVAALMYSDLMTETKDTQDAADKRLNRFCPNAMDDALEAYKGRSI